MHRPAPAAKLAAGKRTPCEGTPRRAIHRETTWPEGGSQSGSSPRPRFSYAASFSAPDTPSPNRHFLAVLLSTTCLPRLAPSTAISPQPGRASPPSASYSQRARATLGSTRRGVPVPVPVPASRSRPRSRTRLPTRHCPTPGGRFWSAPSTANTSPTMRARFPHHAPPFCLDQTKSPSRPTPSA